MQHQLSPNNWSCLPTAVACCLDMKVADVINDIGHDGSAIVNGKPRGFHPIEMSEFCLRMGYGFSLLSTKFEREDQALISNPKCVAGVIERTRQSVSILCGNYQGDHAIACDGKLAYDCRFKNPYPLTDEMILQADWIFIIKSFSA